MTKNQKEFFDLQSKILKRLEYGERKLGLSYSPETLSLFEKPIRVYKSDIKAIKKIADLPRWKLLELYGTTKWGSPYVRPEQEAINAKRIAEKSATTQLLNKVRKEVDEFNEKYEKNPDEYADISTDEIERIIDEENERFSPETDDVSQGTNVSENDDVFEDDFERASFYIDNIIQEFFSGSTYMQDICDIFIEFLQNILITADEDDASIFCNNYEQNKDTLIKLIEKIRDSYYSEEVIEHSDSFLDLLFDGTNISTGELKNRLSWRADSFHPSMYRYTQYNG